MTDTQVGSEATVESSQPVVLIVDDDEEIADTYALWLDGEYDVLTAYSGHEALELLDGEVDVVLLDRRMPGMPGDKVLNRLRDRGVDCQVSMLTAVEPDSDLTELGFDEYLVKPVTKTDIEDVVNELLVRESLNEETQKYLALKSSAETIADKDGEVRDPEAVDRLREQVEEAGSKPQIQAETEQLTRLKKLNELIRAVNRVVVDVDSKDELDAKICAQLVESSPYDWSLIGEYTGTYHEYIPAATSVDASVPDSVTCDPDDPIARAVSTSEIQVLEADEAPDSHVWQLQDGLIEQPAAAAVVVPITYRESVSGALLLWSSEPIEMHERERTMLAEVGRAIGNATDSLQTQEMIHADTLVEVELEVSDRDDVFVDLSAEYSCRVHLEGTNFSSEEGIVCYLSISGGETDEIVEFLVKSEGTANCRVVDERGDSVLVECTLHGASAVLNLIDAGGNIQQFLVEDGRGHISVEVPPQQDVRSLFKTVDESFDDVTFVSKRTVDRSYQSVDGFRGALEEKLTERQDTVVDSAYNAGYFDWPRESTAEEVADDLGLAPPTFHEHLREANRKLVEVYLDETS